MLCSWQYSRRVFLCMQISIAGKGTRPFVLASYIVSRSPVLIQQPVCSKPEVGTTRKGKGKQCIHTRCLSLLLQLIMITLYRKQPVRWSFHSSRSISFLEGFAVQLWPGCSKDLGAAWGKALRFAASSVDSPDWRSFRVMDLQLMLSHLSIPQKRINTCRCVSPSLGVVLHSS